MQEYGGSVSKETGHCRDIDGACDRGLRLQIQQNELATKGPYQSSQQQYNAALMQQKGYGYSSKDSISDQNIITYCRVATGIYEVTSSNQQYQNSRYQNTSVPTFSSPPNSPLVGLVFDSTSLNYTGSIMSDRNLNTAWSNSNQEPIGTGAKKKIVKNQDKRTYTNDPRYSQERYKDNDSDRLRKDRTLGSESTSSLDFFVEGERMVSELCNIPESTTSRVDLSFQNQSVKNSNNDDDKSKTPDSSDVLLTALDKIVIHDQIPNQIVQLAIEACTDAENIAIAHHNRPCFKNIHSICAKTRSNVQKPDSAVANLHSQGIPWVIKNFIFSFVRILDGWKGVKELLSEKHDTFSRIENKYYSPNIRECFVQWQAVTKEMLTHIYRTFKCLDHGFTMEQKSFTHNYYATNSAGPRHQNQNKFQPVKNHASTPRLSTTSPQSFNVVQPPWVQNQNPASNQNFNDSPWPARSGVTCKKIPVIPQPSSQNFFPLNEQSEVDSFQKTQYKEAKPRQSWTITNVADFRALEGLCHADQREIYAQLKHKIDAELGKTLGQSSVPNFHYDMLQRREMELKSKMIPLSHVEKTLIPSMAVNTDVRGCYAQRNNSCGDTKEEDFFAAWGQMVQKEPSDFITHQSHNIQVPPNVVAISNISGPVQFDHENDEFHEMSKVYMKPGSYKVPIKPDPITPFIQGATQDVVYDNSAVPEIDTLKVKVPFPNVTLAPYPKYNLESWPCLMPRRAEDVFSEEHKQITRQSIPCLDLTHSDSLDILSSMTSDRAWEAAKQSAPKLMDIIHEGSKSDTARLYDALGFNNANEEYQEGVTPETWPANHYLTKDISNLWDQDSTGKKDGQTYTEDMFDSEEQLELSDIKNDTKESIRCPHFDQAGSYVRDDNQKKAKQKTSGNWYHPKKKKPLPSTILKKFESILKTLSEIQEAKFIQDDMDIKVAPRFYEVVRYPMCLHDISAKLKNSSYTDQEQVVQDFRRIFNNVRLYLKSYPDAIMKKNVNKVSNDFERLLTEEFQNKADVKAKSSDHINDGHEKDIEKTVSEKKVDQNQVNKDVDTNKTSNCNNCDDK